MRWSVGLIVPLALSLCAPALAANSVTAPDGTTIRVWQSVSLAAQDGPPAHRMLAYSITGPSGTTVGTIDASGFPAAGDEAALAFDPATGNPVVVWSRYDGVALRIAYARLERGGWTDVHDLTFGTGDATQPRIGAGRSGAWLFWFADGTRYVYAPFDLSSGRLFAAPRPLFKEHAPKTGTPTLIAPDSDGQAVSASGGDPSTCGGLDCPVVLPAGQPRRAVIWKPPPSPDPSQASDPALQGNVDAPVILGATTWDVVSSLDCRSLIIVIPDNGDFVLLRFRDGTVSHLGRGRVPALPLPEGFTKALASPHLNLICD